MALPATENFTGAAGPVGANWTQQRTTRTVNRDGAGLGKQDATDATADVMAFWSADSFANDHYSQVVVNDPGASATGHSCNCSVRASATGDASWNAYDFYTDGLSGAGHTELAKVIAGASTVLRNYAATFAAADTMKLTAVSQVIEAFKNGVSLGTQSDSALTSGSPGCGTFANGAGTQATIDNWQGDSMVAAVALRVSNPLIRRKFMKANPRFNTAVPAAVSSAFRRTLHPFGAGNGKRTRNR